MEEFDEADVLWPDHPGDADRAAQDRHQQQRGSSAIKPPGEAGAARRPACSSSAPMGIPVMIRPTTTTMDQGSWARRYHSDDGAASTFVAPHEMVARRRCASEEERSVCVGQGRTLKGRDLRSVRTAVLRMTGFLET